MIQINTQFSIFRTTDFLLHRLAWQILRIRLLLSAEPTILQKMKIGWMSLLLLLMLFQSDQNHHVTYTVLIKFRPINFANVTNCKCNNA